MTRRTATTAAVLAAFMPLCGCSVPLRHSAALPPGASHLLFNPKCTMDSTLDVAVDRADWPATAGFDRQREEIDYRETIMDRQGRSWLDDGFIYRRFDSIRTGRTSR